MAADKDSTGPDLAADWAAAAASDGSGAKALSQNEIDSLLGFDDEGNSAGSSGIQAIINSALVSYERLPMLEVVYDRLVRMLTTSLRNFTSDNVEVTLDSITSTRFGDYLNSVPLPAMLCVFKAKEWDNFGLLTVDSALIYSIVDVLLGGRRGTAAMINPGLVGPDSLVYATFLGGPRGEVGNGICVDTNGGVYVAGQTLGTNTLVNRPGVAQSTYGGGASDAFVAKLILQGRFGPKDVIPVNVDGGEFSFERVV